MENNTDEPICRKGMETQTSGTDLWTQMGKERVGRMGKSNMETSITVCKIDSQREFALWLRKLKQGLCSKLERWFQK